MAVAIGCAASAINRIPFEIWLQIKDLIGPTESNSWYSINRAWFEIVMNARYRVLDVTHLTEDVLSRLPLLKDPGMAKRVRHLFISGVTLQKSLLGTITGQRVEFPMDRSTLSIFNRKIRALDPMGILNAQVRLISEVLSGLNVSEYSVKWDFREGIQSGELIHGALQAAILDSAWPAFGPTLRKISVSTRPERFNAVLASNVQLAHLEEFHLELLHTSNGAQSLGIQDLFPEYVSAFFARVNPQLDTLSIQSSSDLDLSCLFHQLPSFKHLHRLLLHIFLDHGVLSDPSGLESFFAHSAMRLHHLTLFLYHAAVSSVERVLPSLAMTRARISCLETLEIDFGMPHPGLAPTLLHELHDLFNGARSTLHTLVLEGIALSYTDLDTATSVFVDRDAGDTLQSVTLSVLTLTARHIDILAKNLPRISALGIIFMHLSRFPDGPPAPEVECRMAFKGEIWQREYPDWKLRDISIWHHTRSVDTSRWDLVSPFPTCIPTITRFFDQPSPQLQLTQPRPLPRMMLEALTQG
ncbi:hypothetical protein DFH09DRAFT_1167831 [Mycena vulgaris]|nr:hypothetical protein DFH09DRAFT_1167831 [Mycena vulgaris]